MSVLILKDASVVVNAVDLSDHVTEVEVSSSKAAIDVTAMGSQSKQVALGIGDATIKVKFLADFAAAKVDATLQPLFAAAAPFTVVVKPTSAAVSATNPSYTLTAVMPDYTPISGKVGDASEIDVTFQNAAQAGLVRATS